MCKAIIIGAVPTSLSWDTQAVVARHPDNWLNALGEESMIWQTITNTARRAVAEAMAPGHQALAHTVRVLDREGGERLGEVLGLMGAIGEQASLARAAWLDAQRIRQTKNGVEEANYRLTSRAMSEVAGHFILGASHSLCNLVARTLLLNSLAANVLNNRFGGAAGFPPNSDSYAAWLSFDKTTMKRLRQAAAASGNASMKELAEHASVLRRSWQFNELETRRGMDFHRRRPQSVPHNALRVGITREAEDMELLDEMGQPHYEPDADAEVVFRTIDAALPPLLSAMQGISATIAQAIRAERIRFTVDNRWGP